MTHDTTTLPPACNPGERSGDEWHSTFRSQALWSILPMLVTTALSLLSIPFFYRYLGPEQYAVWFYIQTLSGAFGFTDLGLGVTVGRYVGVALGSNNPSLARSFWASGQLPSLLVVLVLSVFFTLTGIIAGPRWFNVAPEYLSLLRWGVIAGGLGLFFGYYGQIWIILSQSHLDFTFLAILRTVMAVFTMVPSIYLVYATRNPVWPIAWAALASILQMAALVWRARQAYGGGWGFRNASWDRFCEMIHFSAKTMVGMLIACPSFVMDRIILGRVLPADSFSHFSIAANVGQRLHGLSTAVMGPIFHNASRSVGQAEAAGPARVYDSAFRLVFGWYILFAIWMSLWQRPILDLWLGSAVAPAVGAVLPPLLMGWCLRCITTTSGAMLGPLNRMGANIVFTAANGILTAAGVWTGWRIGGLPGAAWGFASAQGIWVIQDIWVARLIGGQGWLSLRTARHLAIQCAIAAGFWVTRSLPNLSASTSALLSLALLHGFGVAGWLIWENLNRKTSS